MRRAYKLGLVGTLAMATCLAVQPVSAAESGCANPAVVDAFTIRDLQSRLTVAGLACGQRASYNAFVRAYDSELGRAGRNLVAHFRAAGYGARAVDGHVTQAANVASLHHSEDAQAYCAKSARLFQDLLSESRRSLLQVARSAVLPSVQKPAVCTAKAPATADASEESLTGQ